MTVVPLPDTPAVRVRLISIANAVNPIGNRIFFSYTGGPPVTADLNTIAAGISAAYGTHLAPLVPNDINLTQVDVEDIATYGGASGQWTGNIDGSRAGNGGPIQACANVQYLIGRRYRGGKPKGYYPFGSENDFASPFAWLAGFVSTVNAAMAAFAAECEALSTASCALGSHINLSYKHLFDNVINSSGREKAIPRYKSVATHDVITGYRMHPVMGSQRRRRTSTTP